MRAKENVMDLEQEIERIAKKYGLATVKVVGGKRLMFTCEHGRCSGCDCACHGDTERHIEETVNPEAIAALREMAAFTRKQTLEEAIKSQCRFCAGLDPDVCKEPKFYEGHDYIPNFGEVNDEWIHGDKWGECHYCECSIALLRLQKGEEQP